MSIVIKEEIDADLAEVDKGDSSTVPNITDSSENTVVKPLKVKTEPGTTDKEVTIIKDASNDKETDLYTSPELEKYWKAVKENPADFTGWTYLLQYVEQEHNLDAAREAYDAFLARYPYCYGYWKKYADMEKKHDRFDEAEEIFERGVKAIPLSIDLWIHYINFLTIKYNIKAMLDLKKRQLLDRAITAAGTDFRSDKLWELYINWEKENNNHRHVCALYDRVIRIPTQLYSHQYVNFTKLINEFHPKKYLSLDEFLHIRREIVKPTTEGHSLEDEGATEADDVAPPGMEDLPPGEDAPPPPSPEVSVNGAKKSAAAPKEDDKTLDETEIPAIREIVVQKRVVVHQQTEAEVSKRWTFEDRIRRPYFHVKALEKAQLRNWREYLDFEIAQGSHERVVVLFERCLIACALYEEFWLKYADYMVAHSVDGVRNVFRRACEVHLPKKPSIHLAWAAFEEQQGKYLVVSQIFDKMEKEVPGLVMTSVRRISVERRQGNFYKTSELYEKYIDQTKTKNERAFYAIKYARYLAKVIGDKEKAKEVLEKATAKDPSNPKLLLQLIDLAYTKSPVDEAEMMGYFERGIKSTLAIEHRVAFSQRKMEFLEDFSPSVAKLMQCYEDHQKLLKEIQSKKRKAAGDGSDDPKKAKVGPAPSAVSAVPSTSTGSTDYSQVSSTTDAAYSQAYYNYNYPNYYGWSGYGQQPQQQQGYYQQPTS